MDYVAHDEDDRQRNDESDIGPYVDEAILPPASRAPMPMLASQTH